MAAQEKALKRRATHRVLEAGATLIACIALLTTALLAAQVTYASLTASGNLGESPGVNPAAPETRQRGQGASSAWQPDAIARLTVEGTPIDYVVAFPGADKPSDWYLKHDLKGNLNIAGNPYLDNRITKDKRHRMVFGHRIGFSNVMFGPVAGAFHPKIFQGIGDAVWTYPDGEKQRYEPLMAARVPETFGDIQCFTFNDDEDLRTWLAGLLDHASAKSPEADRLVGRAKSALTLITCSEAVSNQPWRTLVLFTSSKKAT